MLSRLGWNQAPAAPTPELIKDLYEINPQGCRAYKVDKLNDLQCFAAQKACKSEAFSARASAINLGILSTLASAAIVLVSAVIARIATCCLFAVFITAVEVPSFLSFSLLLTSATLIGVAGAGVGGYYALRALWNKAAPHIQSAWNQANHYDSQALDLELRRAHLLSAKS